MRFTFAIVALTFLGFVAASPYSVPASGAGKGGHSTAIGSAQPHQSGTIGGRSAPSSVPSGGPVSGHGQQYTTSGAPAPSGQPGGKGGNGTSTSSSAKGAKGSGTNQHGGNGTGSAGSPGQTTVGHHSAGPTLTTTVTPTATYA